MSEVQLIGRNNNNCIQKTEIKQLVPQVKLRDMANIEVKHEDYLRKFPKNNYSSADKLHISSPT